MSTSTRLKMKNRIIASNENALNATFHHHQHDCSWYSFVHTYTQCCQTDCKGKLSFMSYINYEMKLPLIKTCNITPISLAIQRNSIIASAHHKCIKILPLFLKFHFFILLSSSSSFSIKKKTCVCTTEERWKIAYQIEAIRLNCSHKYCFSHAIFVSRW